MKKIFLIEKEQYKKKITFCGIKIQLKDKYQELEDIIKQHSCTLFELCHNEIYNRNISKKFDVKELLSGIKTAPTYLEVNGKHNFLNLLLKTEEFYKKGNIQSENNTLIEWETRPDKTNVSIMQKAIHENKKIVFIGDSFLRSINTFADDKAKEKYQKGISFTIDDLTSYYDATKVSRLEQMINDKTLIITEGQKKRARACIDKIVKTHLTKYNHQPIIEPEIGRKGVKKVLVVDQSYGDMSIAKGWGSDETFKNMLEAAIKENPDADIIVKTHPDTMTGNRGGYYTGLKQQGNIYTQTTPINPISLIKYVDKVYVCSTQFGFEALMCNKEVRVFGMPFYAGWGLTKDEQHCERRTNKRTLEEIFYLAYIVYSFYVNPNTRQICEIEEAMDYLLNLRKEYFAEI